MADHQQKETLEAKRMYKEQAEARDYSKCTLANANHSVFRRGHC